MLTYVVGTHSKRLAEALRMSTHNIGLHGEIRKYHVDTPSYLKLWVNKQGCPPLCVARPLLFTWEHFSDTISDKQDMSFKIAPVTTI